MSDYIGERTVPHVIAGCVRAGAVRALAMHNLPDALMCFAIALVIMSWGDRRLLRWRLRAVAAVPRTVTTISFDPALLLQVKGLSHDLAEALAERDKALEQRDFADRRLAELILGNWDDSSVGSAADSNSAAP